MKLTADSSSRPVLFFDGECNLCNSFVQFVIRNDKQKRFLFAPLQSNAGKDVLSHISGKQLPPDSVILSYKGKYFLRSAAALTILKLLGGLKSMLYAAIIIPRFIRDSIYDMVARNRHKWFGKRAECMIPTPELKERFIS